MKSQKIAISMANLPQSTNIVSVPSKPMAELTVPSSTAGQLILGYSTRKGSSTGVSDDA